jgi:cardiolipin hydrolase
MNTDEDKATLESLRKYIAMIEEDLYDPKPRYLDTMFFPNEANVERLIQYMNKATKSIKICVFTMTNDKLSNGVNAAWQRGLNVRVISDDECMQQKGSDVHWLSEQGIPVRVDDRPDAHMHNKFMIIDDTHVITGSFNWTVTAGNANQENLLVVDNQYYIQKYNTEFEKLWKQFVSTEVNCDEDKIEKNKQNAAATTIQRGWASQKQNKAVSKKIADGGATADWGALKF